MKNILILLMAVLMNCAALADNTTFTLARELLSEGQYPLAAVEFRRFAMDAEASSEESAAYLYAGYAYLQTRQNQSTMEMLDRAESADATSQYTSVITFLNAENAFQSKDTDTALYFYDLLADDSEAADKQRFALRRTATIHLSDGDLAAAREQIVRLGDNASLAALDAYAAGADKKPLVGGLLGLIPGAGYWYSGETANGFRSLILNSLFMYGMVDTAQDDEWGAFAIITFFEITWYSGSIYGGIDAAHRYNQERLDSTINQIEGGMAYQPASGITLPIFKLDFEF